MEKCPRCGSRNTAKILYGMPAFSRDLQEKLDAKEVVLGGCCISDCDPKYHCNSCRKNFGTPPILCSRKGIEPYPDIVRSIRFMDGGFFGGYREITMQIRKNRIIMDARQSMINPSKGMHREMQPEEWAKVVDTLYNKLYLHEWKKRFYSDALDGEQWELEIHLSDNRIRTYYGSNAFPPYWKELKALFEPYFTEMIQDEDELADDLINDGNEKSGYYYAEPFIDPEDGDHCYLYKKHRKDKVWWVDYPETIGNLAVSFDKKKIIHLFRDYPYAMTKEEKELFDQENPYWAGYFRERCENQNN